MNTQRPPALTLAGLVVGAASWLALFSPVPPPAEPDPVFLPVMSSDPGQLLATPAPTVAPRPVCVVSSLANSGPGTLRDCVSRPGRRVEFARSGAIRLRSDLKVGSGTTIDAGPRAITIRGHGLHIWRAFGVEVRGLVYVGCAGDCITVEQSDLVWLSRGRITGPTGDGQLDIINAPAGLGRVFVEDFIFEEHPKCVLVGNPRNTADKRLRVTFRRVLFRRCRERMPKIHRSKVYMIDSTVSEWKQSGADVQMGGLLRLTRVRWLEGAHSHSEYWTTKTGGRVEVVEEWTP